MQARIIWFILLSIPVLMLSWRPLKSHRNHGFYRFFGWECLLWLVLSNIPYWFKNPFSGLQILSWIIMVYSGILVLAGALTMKNRGKQDRNRQEDALYRFEKTTELIDTGIFRYIRHPLYGSLIFLTVGVYLKNPTVVLSVIAVAAILFFYVTALREEKENITYFGSSYLEYMKGTSRFVPFLW